jgi:hypothetical protein
MLAQGLLALSGKGVQPHQSSMGFLMGFVGCHQPLQRCDGGAECKR